MNITKSFLAVIGSVCFVCGAFSRSLWQVPPAMAQSKPTVSTVPRTWIKTDSNYGGASVEQYCDLSKVSVVYFQTFPKNAGVKPSVNLTVSGGAGGSVTDPEMIAEVRRYIQARRLR